MDNSIDASEQQDDTVGAVATSKQNDNDESKNTTGEKKITAFQKLTPTSLDDSQMADYQEALDFAFDEKDLLNIALSGPYASGKTSIIKSYVDANKKSVIYISLAYFETIGSDDGNSNKSSGKTDIKQKVRSASNQHARELMLERKIINQLIHQVKPEKIPNTEFRVKYEPKKKEVIAWAMIVTLLIFFFYYIQRDWFKKLFEQSTILLTIIWVAVFLGLFCILFELIKVQKRKSIIQRLKVFEAELDISGAKKDESYFDKYLDEILYILERADVEAIIFEDIDRYEDNLILSKLRELNTIYNRKPKDKDKDKEIKFIYLIKDEMFESKDRAKFFDYIIPVVPVVDGGNSFSQINALFDKDKLVDDFKDKAFLHDLSLFLDDMRLIKNIYNEYVIYRQKLVNETTKRWLDYTKLLAIITYKNLFPKDFEASRLGHGRGVLHRIIDSFDIIGKEQEIKRISTVENEIDQLSKEIAAAEKEHLNNLAELMCVYIKLPAQELWFPVSSGVRVSSLELTPIEVIKLLEKNDYEYHYQEDVYYTNVKSCENSFKELEKNADYTRRKAYLEQTKQEYLKLKHNQLQQKESEKIMLSAKKSIKELLDGVADRKRLFTQHFPTDRETTQYETISKEFEEIYSSPYFALLDYLLSGGYIDEDYNDYMSFFYEGGISANEKEFLRNIAKYQRSDWSLPLHHCNILLSSRLQRTSFNHLSILNFSLFDYLVSQKHEFLHNFIATLIKHSQIDFIDRYFTQQNSLLDTLQDKALADRQVKLISFTTMLNRQWPLFWEKTGLDKKYYLYLSFQAVVDTTLVEMNEGERLTQFIDKQTDFLHLEEKQKWAIPKLDSLQSIFEQLAVSFQQITKAFEPSSELFDLVYTHNFYELSIANIDYILAKVHHLPSDNTKLLTSIYSLSEPTQPLFVYCSANIDDVLQRLVELDTAEFTDDEETVIQLLNNEAIIPDNKYAYLAKSATVIEDLSVISNDKEVWDALLEHRLVSYSARNIAHYFFNYEVESDEDEQSINEVLVSFINSSEQIISRDEAGLKTFLDEDQLNTFMDAVIEDEDITNNRYEMLTSWFDLYYLNFDFEEIDSTKLAILINQGKVRLTEEQDIQFIREHYPKNIIALLVKNIDNYIQRLTNSSEHLQDDELRVLLEKKGISEEQKLALIDFASEDISIQGLSLTERIRDKIFERCFTIADIPYITSVEYYKRSSNHHKEEIKQVCLIYFNELLKLSSMAYDLLLSLLNDEELDIESKYQLLTNMLDKLNAEQAYRCFCILEGFLSPDQREKRGFSRVFKGKYPIFEYTNLNMKIAVIIDLKKWGKLCEMNEEANSFKITGRNLIKDK